MAPFRRRIAYLELVDAEDADVVGGEAVFLDDRRVGVTTSGGYGHSVSKSLFFAYLDPEFTRPGQELRLELLGEDRTARVLAGPAYDPENVVQRE